MDAANVDLKAYNDRFYHDLCGADLQTVLDTLVYLHQETDVWLEITTLLIPGENDNPDEISDMTQWIFDVLGPDLPLHFSAFHPDWKLTHVPATPPATLHVARKIAMQNGMRYVYLGNVFNRDGSCTYCHRCGKVVISREGYLLKQWNLNRGNHCSFCGAQIAGLFENEPGSWGSRRKPIDV